MPLELIGTRDVARQLDRDVSTVHRLVEAGQLRAAAKAPGLRGAYLFDPAEVERFLREQTEAAEQIPA